MRVLFLHNNFPAQFRHLASALARDRGNQIVFGTNNPRGSLPGVGKAQFKPHRDVRADGHHYVRPLETAVLNGQAVFRMCGGLKTRGFVPDLIVAHSGWGVGQFVKDAFPAARLLNYYEWYYRSLGTDADYLNDPPLQPDDLLRIRAKNAPILMDLADGDWGLSPTRWQREQFPALFRGRISVLHDGIDTDYFRPLADARLRLNSLDLSDREEIVTYVARGMEPYRGFPQFMQAAAILQRRRPGLNVVVVGADRVAYGRRLPDGQSYKQKMLAELPLDAARTHFTGLLPYRDYLKVIQASSVHVYLTVPFVLSWSMLECLSTGCLVVGSDTAPVREVIRDGENGLLVDFFSAEAVAERVEEVLEHPDRMAALRRAARQTILDRFALRDLLPRQVSLLRDVVAGRLPPQNHA